MSNPSSSQNYYGSQDDAFEQSLLEMPLPLEEEPSPSPPPQSPPPPPELDRPPQGSPQPRAGVVQLESHRRPRPTSPDEEPDEVIQLQRKPTKPVAGQAGSQAGQADPSAPPPSQPGWASLRREKTKAEIEQEKKSIAFGASKFGGVGDYMTNKRMKLQFQQEEAARAGGSSKPQIFKNVAIYVNGLVHPPLPELREMFLQHGGTNHPYLDRKGMVTHIIASNLTPAKIKEFKDYKIVRADWIVKSIEAGKLLPWSQFRWTPNIAPGASQVPAQRAFSFATSKTPSANVSSSASSTAASAASEDRPSKRSKSDQLAMPPPAVTPRRPRTTPAAEQASASPFLVPALPSARRPISTAVSSDPTQTSKAVDRDGTVQAAAVKSARPGYALHGSNEAAKKFMEDEKWRMQHTAASDTFIANYYKQSRLHWLSTWKAELKNLVATAQSTVEASASDPSSSQPNSLSSFVLPRIDSPSRARSKSKDKRVIFHCDFDAFFVSVGRLGRDDLEGKPIVVCHSTGGGAGAASTSEIASPSYEARDFGIKAGMSLGQARTLCPTVQSIPYDFEKYKEVALKFYTILTSCADVIQAVSVDEALVEVTSRVRAHRPDEDEDDGDGFDRAKEVAELVRNEVRAATGCEISIGISSNILLSRLASRKAKPAGSYHLQPAEAASFLAPLSVRDLWGFGRQHSDKIENAFKTTQIADLLRRRVGELQAVLGEKTGRQLYDACRGVDDKPLQSSQERKSVSAEVNYGIRFKTDDEAETFVANLAGEAAKRLRGIGRVARAITLKILTRAPDAPIEAPKFMGHGVVVTSNRSKNVSGPGGTATDSGDIMGAAAVALLREGAAPAFELRGIGIMLSKLEDPKGKPPKALEAGQGKLSFAKKTLSNLPLHTPNAALDSTSLEHLPGNTVSLADRSSLSLTEAGSSVAAQAGRLPPIPAIPTIIPSTPIQARPDLSLVDPAVLAALPESVRKELYPGWDGRDRRSTSRSRSGSPTRPSVTRAGSAPPPPPTPSAAAGPSRLPAASESPPRRPRPRSPVRGGAKASDLNRIVRQLRPMNKVQVSPKRVNGNPFSGVGIPPEAGPSTKLLFGNQLPARVGTDQELVELVGLLGYDLDVLRALPADMLREQLSSMRATREEMLRKGRKGGIQPKVDEVWRREAEERAERERLERYGKGSEEDEEEEEEEEAEEDEELEGEDEEDDDDEEDEEMMIDLANSDEEMIDIDHGDDTDSNASTGSGPDAPSERDDSTSEDEVRPPWPESTPSRSPSPSVPLPSFFPDAILLPPLYPHEYPPPPHLGQRPRPTFDDDAPPSQTLSDLRLVVDKWLANPVDGAAGPRPQGVRVMGDFVVDCFGTKGEENREKGEKVMTWWRFRIGERFGARKEVGVVAENEENEEAGAGRKWWAAWDEVWERVEIEAGVGKGWKV